MRPSSRRTSGLRVQQSRAPEPIGVPPPDVVERREVVALALAYRSIIDVFEGVIAGVRGFVDKSADVEIEFAGAEYDAVDEVHVRAPAPRREVAKEAAGIAVRYVPKLDEFLRPDRLGLDAQGVAESAEGVWKSEKQVAIVIARRANHDVAVGQEDLDFVDRLMCETVAERRGLDAEPRAGSADRDGLELGNDTRQQAVRKRDVDKFSIGSHALDVDCSLRLVDV